MPKSILTAGLLLLAATFVRAENPPEFSGPAMTGTLAEPRNLEASGLAASRRTPGLLWTHNDSGGDPVLYALNGDGSLRGSVKLAGVINRDWEDIAAFSLDGQSWLLVADTGDNNARYAQSSLHVLVEPDVIALSRARPFGTKPSYTINFVYEDGPRDCEAVAVDPRERAVYLLTKRDSPTRLYRLSLAAASPAQPAVARFLGAAWAFPHPVGLERLSPMVSISFPGWPTGMDFMPDGSGAVVLTYGAVYFFPRTPGESWATALARKPSVLPPFSLPQAEAVAISPDGADIYLASERTAQLLRYYRAK